MKIAHRRHFGLGLDPWASLEMDTADAKRAADMVGAAVGACAFVSVLGARGSGKTRAVRAALRTHAGVRVVEPLRLTRERLHMGDIETAIVRDLSDETPRRSGEARSHQVRRILGAASRAARIVLVLDDAHVLHHATLRGLKRLRELAWLGRAPLIGIVLIGQRDRTEMVPEVGLRSDRMVMAGLTRMEVMCALERAGYRAVFEAGALSRLGGCARARRWLDLQALADACLGAAHAAGAQRVALAHVAAVLGGPAPDAPAPAPASDAAIGAFLAGDGGTARSHSRRLADG